MAPPTGPGRFTRFVRRASSEGKLVVQPRMGFGTVEQMRAGLDAVRNVDAATVGTITVDSYTRVNDHASALLALEKGADLNGFPLVAHGAAVTRELLAGIAGDDFPVQVRHGSALPGASAAMASTSATSTGMYSGLHPAITMLIASTSRDAVSHRFAHARAASALAP